MKLIVKSIYFFDGFPRNNAYSARKIRTLLFYLNSVIQESWKTRWATRSGKTRYWNPSRLPKCPRIFIVPNAMQEPRAGNDLGYFARDCVWGCRSPRGNRIFHLAGYWTNEKLFGENDSEMSVGNLTVMPSVQ